MSRTTTRLSPSATLPAGFAVMIVVITLWCAVDAPVQACCLVHNWYNEITQPAPSKPQSKAPIANDTTFVVDTGSGFYKTTPSCLFRVNGPIYAYIPISRVIGDRDKLKDAGLLPKTARLRIVAWDVDKGGREVDRVTFNGHVLDPLEGNSDDCHAQWGNSDYEVDTDWIHFPEYDPEASSPGTAIDTVKIDIDVASVSNEYCTLLDYVSLEIRLPTPLIMIHGIVNPNTWNSLWVPHVEDLGLPYSKPQLDDPPQRINGIYENSGKIKDEVADRETAWGVKKVNLVTHSKGGLDARVAAFDISSKLNKIMMMSPPNAGTPVADSLVKRLLGGVVPGQMLGWLGEPGGMELTTRYMRRFNAMNPISQAGAEMNAIGGACDATPASGSFNLGPFGNFLLSDLQKFLGDVPNDAIVPEWSVAALSPSIRFLGSVFGVCHTSMTASSAALGEFSPYLFPVLESGVPQPPQTDTGTGPITTTCLRFGELTTGQTSVRDSFYVDETGQLSVAALGNTAMIGLKLIRPSGDTLQAAMASVPSGVSGERGNVFGAPASSWTIAAPDTGKWRAIITVDSLFADATGTSWSLSTTRLNSVRGIRGVVRDTSVEVGQSVKLQLVAKSGSTAIAGLDSSYAIIARPDSGRVRVSLADGGVSPDSSANDGIYTGTYTTTQRGVHFVTFVGKEKATAAPASFERYADGEFDARSGSSHLRSGSNRITTSTVDVDSDGLIDTLNVNVEYDIDETSTYGVLGVLTAPNGATFISRKYAALTHGFRTVTLPFSGAEIFNAKANGPYTLTSLLLVEPVGIAQWPLRHETRLNGYTTSSMSYASFEHPPIWATDSVAYAAVSNTNGYGSLRVTPQFSIPDSGDYIWSGHLEDASGNAIGRTEYNSGQLVPGIQGLELPFSGFCINRAGLDGPYYLRGVTVIGPCQVNPDSPFHGVTLDSTFTWNGNYSKGSAAFAAAEFSLALGIASEATLDRSLMLCPAGDADSLAFSVKIPHKCGEVVDPAGEVWTATRSGFEHSPLYMWEAVSPSDATGATLHPKSVGTSTGVDSVTFVVKQVTGAGYPEFALYLNGDYATDSPETGTDSLRSVDMDYSQVLPPYHNNLSIGSVDRFDVEKFTRVRWNPVFAASIDRQMMDFNFDGSVTDADSLILMSHLGHHVPRQFVWPTNGQIYAPGDTVRISWKAGLGDSAKVTIRAVRGATSDTTLIVLNQADTGSYVWTVPSTLRAATNYKIQVLYTAGNYLADYRNLGIASSDTAIGIRPLPVSSLASSTGRHSWTVTWTEPTQNGGQEGVHYDIRINPSGTISESNFGSLDSLVQDAPPGPGTTAHCIESFDPYDDDCHAYRVAIKTYLGGLWSKMQIADFATRCSGSFEVAGCSAGGLMAGGGGEGGGEESLRSTHVSLASDGSMLAPNGEPDGSIARENTLCGWAHDSYIIDRLQLPSSQVETDSGYVVRLRQATHSESDIDVLSLGFVDRASGEESYASSENILVGSTAPTTAAWSEGASGPARTPTDGEPFVGTRGASLSVSLGAPRAGRGIVVRAKTISPSAYTDSTGIAVAIASPGLPWQLAGAIHPRRDTDAFAVALSTGQEVRLVFYGDYEISGLREFAIERQATLTPLALVSATHSQYGEVRQGLAIQDEQDVALQFGDTLLVRYGLSQHSEQQRDLYLTARARNQWIRSSDSPGAHTSGPPTQVWSFALGQARPNPSTTDFTIDFSLAKPMPVSIRIYDVAGRLVRTLLDETRPAGPHTVVWNGKNDDGHRVAASVYFYRMVAESFVSERKAVLLTR